MIPNALKFSRFFLQRFAAHEKLQKKIEKNRSGVCQKILPDFFSYLQHLPPPIPIVGGRPRGGGGAQRNPLERQIPIA
jgi:hypothetical protein